MTDAAETLDGQVAELDDQVAELATAELTARESGQPVVLELGRYRVFQAPDGGWVVARAVDTCERCQGCGCGTQAEPIAIPAMVIKVATMQGAGLADKLRALRAGRKAANGNDGD